jgi:hypothetical protein
VARQEQPARVQQPQQQRVQNPQREPQRPRLKKRRAQLQPRVARSNSLSFLSNTDFFIVFLLFCDLTVYLGSLCSRKILAEKKAIVKSDNVLMRFFKGSLSGPW